MNATRVIHGVVKAVYDGDTFTLKPDVGDELKVRLIGVDTPEINGSQPFSMQARDRLKTLILGKRIHIKAYQLDIYGRQLGSVDTSAGNVSVILVKEGLAVIYRKGGAEYGDIGAQLTAAEDFARNCRLGIWNVL